MCVYESVCMCAHLCLTECVCVSYERVGGVGHECSMRGQTPGVSSSSARFGIECWLLDCRQAPLSAVPSPPPSPYFVKKIL